MSDLPKAYCYEVVKAMCDTEFSRTKVKDAILNEPLFTATQMREYRNQALEDAAKVCEQTEIVTYIYGTQVHDSGAETLSNAIDAIRALKEQK